MTKIIDKIYKELFYTSNDVNKNSPSEILLRGFLVPSQNKRFFEIWFPYSIEAAQIIKPNKFLCATNFSNFYHYKDLISHIGNNTLSKAYFSVLEIVDIEIIHYEIFAMSQEPQKIKLEEAFEKYKKSWHRSVQQGEDDNLRIVVKAVSTNVDLVYRDAIKMVEEKKDKLEFVSPSEQPVYGEDVYIMKPPIVEKFLNGKYSYSDCKACFKSGYHKMYKENSVSIFLNHEQLFNRHFAVFGFSGAGKSNLLSTIIHRSMENSDTNANIVIFDTNSEYVGLLLDTLFLQDVDSQIIFLENPGGDLGRFLKTGLMGENEEPINILQNAAEQFFNRLSLPDELTNEKDIILCLESLLLSKKVKIYFDSYNVSDVLIKIYFPELEKSVNSNSHFKTKEKELLQLIKTALIFRLGFYGFLDMNYTNFAHYIISSFLNDVKALLIGEKQANDLYLGIEYFDTLIDNIISYKNDVKLSVANYTDIMKFTLQDIVLKNDLLSEYEHSINTYELLSKLHDNNKSLIIVISDEDNNLRTFAHELGSKLYNLRKNGKVTNLPQVLFLFEEADLFIPMTPTGDKQDKESIQLSKGIATTFARRGRKYKLGVGISTQRTTYLDTNIVSQLSTYLVSKLPRRTDRERVAEAFGIEQQIIDGTLSLDIGEWMIISHSGALNRKSIPVLVRFENANDRVNRNLKDITKKILQDIERQQENISQENNMDGEFNSVEENLLPVYVDLDSEKDSFDVSEETNNTKTHKPIKESVNEADKNVAHNNKDKYFEFFSLVVKYYKQKQPSWRPVKPQKNQNWLCFGAGKMGLSFCWYIREKSKISVELYIDKGNEEENKNIFNKIKSFKDLIESNLGFSLDWNEMPGKRACRISCIRNIGSEFKSLQDNQYDELAKWCADTMSKFKKELFDIISQL